MKEVAPIIPLWRGRVRRRARRALPFLSGICTAFLILILYNALTPHPHQITQTEIDDSITQAIASITPAPARAPLIYQKIQPSLVLIQTESTDANNATEDSLGSGIIVNDRGDILTSLHVVANATRIHLTFADGTQAQGRITVKQPENDIAVLRASKLPAKVVPATLGNPGAMRIGDEAFVVGHPFGLYGSMSSGVISGLKRSFKRPDGTQSLTDLIQIDAAVNPGNSGGPLLNRNGEVVGIVAALLNPTEQEVFIGIGFAVPITTAGGAAGAPPV